MKIVIVCFGNFFLIFNPPTTSISKIKFFCDEFSNSEITQKEII